MEVVTFIHTSGEDTEVVYTPLIPIGMIGLASFLENNHIRTRIVNLELERALDPGFDFIKHLKQNHRKIVCLSLHWHSQSARVVQVCRKIKTALPDSKIVLGGFTASYFAREILQNFSMIDFIIAGESEEPLLKLMTELLSGGNNFGQVPNLVWRKNQTVIVNSEKYNTPQEIVDGLEFGNFALMKSYRQYFRIDFRNRKEKFLSNDQPVFYYNCGRGCPVNCSFCGGSNISQRMINKRTEVLWIGHDAVMRELKRVHDQYGITRWHTSFDPFPDRSYYVELFQRIRSEQLEFHLGFECWSLPSREFIDEFSRTFNPRSKLEISPECGSNEIRRKNKGYYYSNEDLIKTLEYIQSKKIPMNIFLSAGLAFETMAHVRKTLQLIQVIRRKIPTASIKVFGIEMEPGAPWYLNPQQYGIELKRKNFLDFYERHKRHGSLGYRSREFAGQDIKKLIDLYNSYNHDLMKKYRVSAPRDEATARGAYDKMGRV